MIDLVLILLMLGYAISGYRQGLVVAVLSLTGFVGGALLAMWLVPSLLSGVAAGVQRSVLVLLLVVITAWLGQFLGALLGSRLRENVSGSSFAVVDQAAGAISGLVAVALVVWFVAGAVRGGPSPALSRAVASSRVIGVINGVMPQQLNVVAENFRAAVGSSAFPRVFAGVGPEDILPVSPPDSAVAASPAVETARRSIVKITGEATSCSRGQEGSGFVVGRHRVVTNAHVVAGVKRPRVQVGGVGPKYSARVVLFDAKRDVAVLSVPALDAPALRLGSDLTRGDSAVVAGFPQDGPFRADAARVRSVLSANGEDIYGRPGAQREVYSLYTVVQPGNSGGPVLSARGSVVGVVFAKSLDDANTGYALTMNEARRDITLGLSATTPVGTGDCAVG